MVVVEHLPNKFKALSVTPPQYSKKRKEKKMQRCIYKYD
jgi:hypothetical protein